MEDKYPIISSLRKKHLDRRQQNFKDQFEKCHAIVEKRNFKHPYQIDRETFQELNKLDFFYSPDSPPSKVDKDFLFSLCSFDKFFSSAHLSNPSKYYTSEFMEEIMPLDRAFRREELFERINKYFTVSFKNEWIPISRLLKGIYYSREFNWWTCLSVKTTETEDIISHAYKCGIPADWISDLYLMMRYKVNDENKNKIKIPTEINAFLSCVFRQRNLNQNPSTGKTIPLDEEISLDHFYREYVIKNPEVSSISFKLIRVKNFEKVYLRDIEKKLLDLYSKL